MPKEGLRHRGPAQAPPSGSQTAESGADAAKRGRRCKMTRREKMQVAGALLLLPLVFMANPTVVDHFGWMKNTCTGVCDIDPVDRNMPCGPTDTDRVVYLRIPKTGSSTVEAVIKTWAKRKHFSTVYFEEDNEIVETINSTVDGKDGRKGYLDKDPQREKAKRAALYRKIVENVLWPPWQGTRKNVFYGHIMRVEWTDFAGMPGRNFAEMIPEWIKRRLHVNRASAEELSDIEHFTIVRDPRRRLQSMYYFSRTNSRTKAWREQFLALRGNMTFEECLLDPDCVEQNELRRRCNVQTEILCGVHEDCARPLGGKALELAKSQVENNFVLVGTTERMHDSLRLLERILPTYFEGLSENLDLLPELNKTPMKSQEIEYSAAAEAVLQDLCSVDLKLYEFVDALLRKKLNECSQIKY